MGPGFPANVYLCPFVGCALLTALAVPFWRAICPRLGLLDNPGGRKIHSHPIPLAGGLAIWSALMLSILGTLAVVKSGLLDEQTAGKLLHGFARRQGQLASIFCGATGMVLLGVLDDKHELKPLVKFAGQVLIATLVAAAGIRITLFVPNVPFSYFITILWILTVINAFNFMDNMNGLCAGLGCVATLMFGLTAALRDQYLVAAISFLTAGALLGFLPYNFPRATVFLGDTGSHLIGYLLAVLAILPHFYTHKNPQPWAVLSPLLILAVPLADLVWVVALRWRRGLPFYIGDTNHLSHRLVRRGFSSTQSILLIWLLAAVIGALGLLWR